MKHVRALMDRWLQEAHEGELLAIKSKDDREALDLRMRANQFRLRACELDIAIQMDEREAFLEDNPILEQTIARN